MTTDFNICCQNIWSCDYLWHLFVATKAWLTFCMVMFGHSAPRLGKYGGLGHIEKVSSDFKHKPWPKYFCCLTLNTLGLRMWTHVSFTHTRGQFKIWNFPLGANSSNCENTRSTFRVGDFILFFLLKWLWLGVTWPAITVDGQVLQKKYYKYSVHFLGGG